MTMSEESIQQYPLLTPEELSGEFSLTPKNHDFLMQARSSVNKIIHGHDHRVLVVVGPCSIHDPAAALDYAKKLKKLNDVYHKQLFIVMRVYFEKPRTSLGWKGLIHDPHLNNHFDIETGLKTARKLLLDINSLGLPVGAEFVDTLIPQYSQDLVTWGAIGARTSESQTHRQLASSLALPIGFKNTLSGNIHAAINAVRTATQPQQFLSIDQQGKVIVVNSTGNKNCHIILRGGRNQTNFDKKNISDAQDLLKNASLNPYIMVDCSHGNSQNDPTRQKIVVDALCQQLTQPDAPTVGVMLESNLNAGKQDFQPGKTHQYGVSITDACISWEETQMLLEKLSHAVKIRHEKAANCDLA